MSSNWYYYGFLGLLLVVIVSLQLAFAGNDELRLGAPQTLNVIRIRNYTHTKLYSWMPEIAGEGLSNEPCLQLHQFIWILEDELQSDDQKADLFSQFTCRMTSNLECVNNTCECMEFGGTQGAWDNRRLKCYQPLGASCASRTFLFPGKNVRTIVRPVCQFHAECSDYLLSTKATCACDEDKGYKVVNNKCILKGSVGNSHVVSLWTFLINLIVFFAYH